MTDSNPPILLKIRGGVEVDSYGKRAGKGPLISENLSMTLGVSQDQYLFQPVGTKGYPCVLQEFGLDTYNQAVEKEVAQPLRTSLGGDSLPKVCCAYSVENHPNDSRYRIDDSGIVQTLMGRMGTGGGNEPIVMLEQKTFDARWNGDGEATSTITGDHENRITDYTNVVIEPFSENSRAKTSEDATTWKHSKVANTLNTFDTGEQRANELVVMAVDCRNAKITGEITHTLQAKPNGGISVNCIPSVIADGKVINLNKDDVQSKAVIDPSGVAPSLYAGECRGGGGELYVIAMATQQGGAEITENLCPTITAAAGMSGNNQPVVCIEGNGSRPSHRGDGYKVDDKMYTLNTIDRHAVCYGISSMGSNAMRSSNPHSGIYEAKTSRTLDLNGGNPACNQGGIIVCQTFAMQGFGDYKQSDKASGVKARDYKDSTDLCVIKIQEIDSDGKPVRC